MSEEEFVPQIVGYRPFHGEESRDAIVSQINARIVEMQAEMVVESRKGAANDVKLEAHRWATEFLLPDIISNIRTLELKEPIMMVEDGVIEIGGQRISVSHLAGLPDEEESPAVETPDPNRLTPEFVGEPNERVAIDTIAETITPLDNPNIPYGPEPVAPAPFAPQLDEVPTT